MSDAINGVTHAAIKRPSIGMRGAGAASRNHTPEGLSALQARPHILTIAERLAGHTAARHAVIAANIANADTPGYKAQDLQSFTDSYDLNSRSPAGAGATMSARGSVGSASSGATSSFQPFASRNGHVLPPTGAAMIESDPVVRNGATTPNGNTVSLEHEMVTASQNRLQHELAVGVWTKSLAILRQSLGKK